MKQRRGNRHVTSVMPSTVFSKIGPTLFFAFFLAMGLAFCAFVGVEFFQNLGTHSWRATEATITHSAIERDRDGSQYFDVGYQYVVDDRVYTATGYTDPRGRRYQHDDRASLERLAARYPVGRVCTAYVHPSQPGRAILEHPSLWIGLVAFFPLIFVAVGAGGIFFTWFGASFTWFGTAAARESLAERSRSKHWSGKWILRGMGVVFTAVGLVAAYFILIGPMLHVHRAKSWAAAPGRVIASRVVSHHGDDSTTYSVDILYEYEIGGRTLRSNRYHFATGSSSGRPAKQAIVDAHPPGKTVTVYVNPSDPFDAVVERGYPNDLWFGLIPLIFCVAGAAMFVGSFYVNRQSRRTGRAAWLPDTATIDQGDDPFASLPKRAGDRVTLRRTVSRVGKLAGVTVAALVWNGVTGVFVGIAVNSHFAGDPEWFLTLFIIPFVLVGIGLLLAIPYQCLALLNPSPILEVNTAAPALGSSLTIDWRLEGRADRVAVLTLSLVGEEHATYRRGTDTVTDKHTFYDETLLKTSDSAEIGRGGHLDILIPADVMHSFAADHNKIIWKLKVAGDIKRWPDVHDEYPLVVRPIDLDENAHA